MKLLLILLLLYFPADHLRGSLADSQTAPAAASPEAVVKEFYRWYLTRLSQNHFPLKQEKAALQKYLTPEFLRKAPGIVRDTGADAFICAQDWDEGWSQNITVSKLSVKGPAATMTVFLKGKQFNQTLKVRTRQISGQWRVDGVQAVEQ